MLTRLFKPITKDEHLNILQHMKFVATPFGGKCEDETHTPKSGNLESFRTPATSEFDCKGQNTLPRGFLYRWKGLEV